MFQRSLILFCTTLGGFGLATFLLLSGSSDVATAVTTNNPTTYVTYTPTTTHFANPERGFYHHTETTYGDLNSGTLLNYRQNEEITLILRVFYLGDFVTTPISTAYLDDMTADFAAARQAGVKVVARFAYAKPPSWPPTTPYGDATPEQTAVHLAQLEPILRANGDVIATVQIGFVGLWGEWYYTDYFTSDQSNLDNISVADYVNRRTLSEHLLDSLPPNRTVQVRTPFYKMNMYGSTEPITGEVAFGSSYQARMGHHNDCFLASSTDSGTYKSNNIVVEKDFLTAETQFTPMGGETCAVEATGRSECPTALLELERFHWSYINTDYHPDVLQSWVDDGCMDEITNRLGYRLVLEAGEFGAEALPSGLLPISLTLRNEGFAAPYNSRPVELILREQTSQAVYFGTLPDDPRMWSPEGVSHTLQQTLSLPADLPVGHYDLLLHLPDPAVTLYGNPAYSIRLANDDMWESGTGYNDLGVTVVVTTAASVLAGTPSVGVSVSSGVTETAAPNLMGATQDNSGYTLFWTPLTNYSYEIWEAETPYQNSDFSLSGDLAVLTGESSYFVPLSEAPNGNRFYAVVGVNEYGVSHPTVDRWFGAFVFGLEVGE